MDRELDLRLKEIRGRITQVDPMLVRLLHFASESAIPVQYGLTVLLDGVMVMGVPAPSATTGKILDAQSVRYFRAMQAISMNAGSGPGSWPEVAGAFKDAAPYFSQAKMEDEAQSKVIDDIGDADIDDIIQLLEYSGDLADRAVHAFAPPKAFTLTNAHMRLADGTNWEEIPNIRVNLSSVRAWWTFELGVPDEVRETLADLESEVDESPDQD